MQGRTLAILLLFFGAAISFALAVWRAVTGGLPLVETAHAVLFAVMGLILVAKPETSGGCRDCGRSCEATYGFCLGCGCFPKPRAA